MKAIIWIIVLLLLGWGVWWYVQKDDLTDTTTVTPATGEVQGASDTSTIDENFDSKG